MRDDNSKNYPEVIDIDKVISALKRNALLITYITIAVFGLGILSILTSTKRYTAETQVLIDSIQANVVQDVSSGNTRSFETAAIDSQVEIIGSQNTALMVIKALKLQSDPDFFDQSIPENEIDPVARSEKITEILLRNLQVRRVGQTYVLSISYTAKNAEKAANIANAFADAYINGQLDARFDSSSRAAEWLQHRIGALRKKYLAAEEAIQTYRYKNQLIDTSGGKLVNDQQLTEVNTQLIAARAQTSGLKAKYEHVQAIIKTGNANAAVAEALDNTVVNNIRAKYLDTNRRMSDLAAKLGNNHKTVVRLRNELGQYERIIFKELQRIAESYGSDFEIAKVREESLEKSLDDLIKVNVSNNSAQITLRELEREADTLKQLYESNLQGYEKLAQIQSFPVTEARIITKATKPLSPSHPKVKMVLAISLILGLGTGFMVALFREMRDKSLRTGAQMRDILGIKFLGFLPLIHSTTLSEKDDDAALTLTEPAQSHTFNMLQPTSRFVLDHPLSMFSETLRSIKTAIALKLKPKANNCVVIGIISSLQSEGKSTLAANLGLYLAKTKKPTLLIDADLRNPSLTRNNVAGVHVGLSDILENDAIFDDVVLHEMASGLDLLPSALHDAEFGLDANLLSSEGLNALINSVASKYNYIILDLPPMALTMDVFDIYGSVDGFILVAEWGKTSIDTVSDCLLQNELVAEKIIGGVLNKADLKNLHNYSKYIEHYRYAPQKMDKATTSPAPMSTIVNIPTATAESVKRGRKPRKRSV